LKQLEKASTLSASDDPKDQDKAREIRVMHDYADLKKQIGKNKRVKESVEGDFKAEKTRRKARIKGEGDPDQENPMRPAQIRGHDQEPTAANLAAERRRRELKKHPGIDPTRKFNQEGFSNWRDDLREIVSDDKVTDDGSPAEVKEKKVNNKKLIKINPTFQENAEQLADNLGGELLSIHEVVDTEDGEPKEDPKEAQKKKMELQMKKRIIRMKLRAANSGEADGIVAGYEPEIEGAVQYFYEQGINEVGLEQLIEDIGLDEFVNFVLDASQFLTEETEEGRPARKMNVRTLKSTKKKAAEIKADRSDVVKRGTPVDTLRRARAERSTKKPKLAQPAKPAVVKSVAKVKKTQPAKKPNKQGLRDRVTSALRNRIAADKKGVRKVRDTIRKVQKSEFGKGVGSGVKAVGKAAKDIHSITQVNKKKTVNMQSYEPEGEHLDEVH